MAILPTELVLYRAAASNNGGTNGGRMIKSVVTSGTKNNVFPDVSLAEKTAGLTNFRKVFFKVDNTANLALQNSYVFVEKITNGDDAMYIHAGTQSDLQSSLSGAERLYGAGTLSAATLAGDTSCSVVVEDPTVTIFADGDIVRVSAQPDINTVGNTEFKTIAVGGVSAPVGNVVTLTFTTGMANAYAISDKVASTMPTASIATVAGVPALTTSAGTLDTVLAPIAMDNTSTVDETWTLTFTSATAFYVVGATLGNVGAGNTTSDTTPNNPDYGLPYFTLPLAAFGGTWASGDTVVFTTAPAAAAIWIKKVVPAGAASLTANTAILVLEGESA